MLDNLAKLDCDLDQNPTVMVRETQKRAKLGRIKSQLDNSSGLKSYSVFHHISSKNMKSRLMDKKVIIN